VQLLALKQKMGILPAGAPQQSKQIGAGAPPNEETVHAEVEESRSEETK
jgi:hypothetical protein